MRFKTLNIQEEQRILEILTTIVCKKYNLSKEQIFAESKDSDIVKPRQLIQALCLDMFKYMSIPQIGLQTGGKTHATVIYSFKTWTETYCLNKTDDSLYNEIKSSVIEIILKERNTGFPCYDYFEPDEILTILRLERNKLSERIKCLNQLEKEICIIV